MNHHSAKLLLGFLCLTLVLAAATPASARTRTRTTQSPRGSSTRTVDREPGRAHREAAVTNNRDQTTTREVDRTRTATRSAGSE